MVAEGAEALCLALRASAIVLLTETISQEEHDGFGPFCKASVAAATGLLEWKERIRGFSNAGVVG